MTRQILLPTSVRMEMVKTFKITRSTLDRALKYKGNSARDNMLRKAAFQRGGVIYLGITAPKGYLPDVDHFRKRLHAPAVRPPDRGRRPFGKQPDDNPHRRAEGRQLRRSHRFDLGQHALLPTTDLQQTRRSASSLYAEGQTCRGKSAGGNPINRTVMRRFLKYWMIRLLGRGFIILPLRCKLAGLWWSFSLMVICGYVEQQQQWPLLVITANFAGSTFAVMAVFKTRK